MLDADPVAPMLRTYMDSHADFEGTASELLKALNEITPERQTKAKDWPKRPHILSGILRRIDPPLRKVGIDIGFIRRNRQRTIKITRRVVRVGKTASPASPSSLSKDGNGLDQTGERHPSVTAGTESVTGDDGDAPGDASYVGSVTAKPLEIQQSDAGDADDADLLTLTGARCAHCGEPLDGTEAEYWIDGEQVRLHRRCERAYQAGMHHDEAH